MTLDSYIANLKEKTITVIGLGVSNRPLINLLLNGGCAVSARDKRSREQLGEYAEELINRGCRLILGESYLDDITEDIIFRTPGLHPFAEPLRKACERGSVLTSEMEAFFKVCPCSITAITGSDGKTTTSTVISELLKAAGYKVWLGGNIGTPLLDKAPEMKPEDKVVLELSSFQLHSMNCSPDVSVITNLAPNHLDVHPDFADYCCAKKNIFLRQTSSSVTVLNADNEITNAYSGEVNGSLRHFSRQAKPVNGTYLREGIIYRVHDGIEAPLMKAEEILIPGNHNIENYMAAFSATDGIVSDECCRKVAATFPGVPHRLERIRVLNGVIYCNDSIASSPSRTAAGLYALKLKPILIAGGYDKHIPFDKLGEIICERVKALFLTGNTADAIKNAVLKAPNYCPDTLPIIVMDDFTETVLAASQYAKEGDMVLLSPACASFDKFKNFEERGNLFRSIVLGLE